jgi:hypothetical protein
MAQKKRDFGLILSLGLIIVIAGYWFVKEVPMDGVEHYVDLLGDKLMTLIPKDQDKEEVAAIYNEFKTKVKEKKVSPENVEQVASAIINLSNASDSISLSEVETLIRIAVPAMSVDSVGLVQIPDVEASPEEWEELNKRLSGVYHIQESLEDHVIVAPEDPRPRYRVDKGLNVIVDNRVKKEMKRAQLEELEKETQLIWEDSVAEDMEKNLHKLEIELKALSEEMEEVEIRHNLLKLKVLTMPAGEEVTISLDSLDFVNLVDWDSLESEVLKEIKHIEIKGSKRGIVVEPEERP